MGPTNLLKRSKAYILTIIFCLFTDQGSARNKTIKNFCTTLRNTKEYCKNLLKKSCCFNNLDHKALYQHQQVPMEHGPVICSLKNPKQAGTVVAVRHQIKPQPIEPTDRDKKREIILDAYEKIKNFYAYDPIAQAWMQIKFFRIIDSMHDDQPIDPAIDHSAYIRFWAYDLSHKTWHRVSLIPYLQQPNTQINSDAATATKKTILPDQNNLLHDQPVVTDELLEELLGVHTAKTSRDQTKSIWRNFSFDCTLGVGAIFYTNDLQDMQLLQKQSNTYFFRTKTGEIYKPNWFYDQLKVDGSNDPFDGIEHSATQKTKFKGKGLGVPITLGITYLFGQRLCIGLGREMVFNATDKLTPHQEQIAHKAYRMDQKWSAQGRWFVKCGCYGFGNEKHRLFGDIRLFHVDHLGSRLANLVTFRSYLHQAVAYNFGIGYQQQLTDYLAYTTRLSIELQKFKQFPNRNEKNYNIHYTQPAIYLQVGLSRRFTKSNPAKDINHQAYPTKNHTLKDPSKLNGLEGLLDLDA